MAGSLIFKNRDDSSKNLRIGYVSDHKSEKDPHKYFDLDAIINLYHSLHDGQEIDTFYMGLKLDVGAKDGGFGIVEPREED